ncbi:PREDICTED: acyl-protein thioesterase 2 [Camelina sativa]|uniref:Acyl-protein thioesterase 2 n=1 Tax=Camelina sativa TaxID=90675 RepID=A0ABM0X2F4_CAMSA|nr:PREDICTED: acyl-protein thioesterase 2 [Camelina sativa]
MASRMLFSSKKSMASGSGKAKVTRYINTGYGDTEAVTVNPTEKHQATIVWLHDLNGTGYEASDFVKSFSLYNVKWICPNAPSISDMGFYGEPARAWFKVNGLSTSGPLDPYEIDDLKNATAYVARLLKNEPEHVMKGVAGYGIGGALVLHIATCCALGSFPIKIRAVVGINCWLPNRFKLEDQMNSTTGATSRAAELPILITHGYNDKMVPFGTGGLSSDILFKVGFIRRKLKIIHMCDHAINFQVMTDVSLWLTKKFELEGEPDEDPAV